MTSFIIPAVWVLLLWGIWLVFRLWELDPGDWGVMPRKGVGLPGILTSPFVHARDYQHLLSNSLPLFFLMAGLLYFYRTIAWPVVIWLILATGFWVWAAARTGSSHIGASGIVYGLASFLFFSGVFRRHPQAIALALIVAFIYGSMVWGVLPLQPGVSWESHLFGAIAGLVLAFYYRHKGLPPRKRYSWEDENEQEADKDEVAPWNYKKLFPPPEGFQYPE